MFMIPMNSIYHLSPLILQKVIWIPTRLILKFFVHLEIRGIENLYQIHQNVIFASNHSSELDPILLPASLPFWSRFSPIFYTSRLQSFYKNSGWKQIIYGGTLFKLWGAHPAYSGLKDYEKSLMNHICLLSEGKNLFIFPEGRITRDGAIQHAHGGMAYLAERCKLSIVPIGISGAYKLSMRDFLMRRRKIILTFGKPIEQSELRREVAQKTTLGEHVYKEEGEYVLGKIGEMVGNKNRATSGKM